MFASFNWNSLFLFIFLRYWLSWNTVEWVVTRSRVLACWVIWCPMHQGWLGPIWSQSSRSVGPYTSYRQLKLKSMPFCKNVWWLCCCQPFSVLTCIACQTVLVMQIMFSVIIRNKFFYPLWTAVFTCTVQSCTCKYYKPVFVFEALSLVDYGVSRFYWGLAGDFSWPILAQ